MTIFMALWPHLPASAWGPAHPSDALARSTPACLLNAVIRGGKRLLPALTFLLLWLALPAQADPSTIAGNADAGRNNVVLAGLMSEDQTDRRLARSGGLRAVELQERDARRRTAVLSFLRSGEVRTSDDFYAAALIFQHGDSVADHRLAHSLSTIAVMLAPGAEHKEWLQAASWDRLMRSLGKPQWYGTQYTRRPDGQLVLQEMDRGAVSDAERARLRIFPLDTPRRD